MKPSVPLPHGQEHHCTHEPEHDYSLDVMVWVVLLLPWLLFLWALCWWQR